MKSVKPLKEFQYTVKSDRKEKTPTTFTLIGLTTVQSIDLGGVVTNQGEAEATLHVVRIGLKGWKNFDADFTKDMDKNINCIPARIVKELSDQIMLASSLSETERKN